MQSSDSEQVDSSSPAAASTTAGPAVPPTPYLLRALLVGAVLALPVGYLLAYLAPMPYFLGLFFFLLLALLVGASMCRAARPAAPIPRERMTPVSLIVALLIWTSVIFVEYRWFPDYAVRNAVKMSLTTRMTSSELTTYRQHVRKEALEQLNARYRPGGFLGYLRWAVTSGRMDLPRGGSSEPVALQNVQLPVGWIIRVSASLVLLLFGVDSQMASLAPKPLLKDEPEEHGENES